ncbi:MAG: RrF2 family transcriptional regulator, partial [Phycisphaerae bacterium]
QTDEQRVPGNQIAEHTQVPKKYLSKILGDLVRAGILDSAPGKTGGFRLLRSPKEIYLFEVLAPFEPVLARRRPCPFGNSVCSDDDPCVGHERWSEVRETYSRFLQGTSIHDISAHRKQRRRRQLKKRIRR